MSFGTLPQADFTFQNGNEVETIDPSLATGQPEHRVLNCLFEGLLVNLPVPEWDGVERPGENVPLTAQPGMAESYKVSEDGRTYTFVMRKNAKWSDGSPVIADDFAWTWMRMLHPDTASRYAYQLYYIVGAEKYNRAQVEAGDAVEVELPDRQDPLQPFPPGTLVRGVLKEIQKQPEPALPAEATAKERADANAAWKRRWVYAVEVASTNATRLFSKESNAGGSQSVERCLHVLPNFEKTVGVVAESAGKLIVKLNSRTPYFADLLAFYPTFPVNRRCVEAHGSPNWTKAENIVTNGVFKLQFRRIRDRLRMVKNEHHWDAERVEVQMIDALAMKSETTALNMYLNGQLDWAPYVPVSTIPILKEKYAEQFHSSPMLTVYMYRVNVTRPELSDKRVRQALNLAIDKAKLCEQVTRGGEAPATTYVPPGLAGYVSPAGQPMNIPEAQRLLAEAGYPGGRGLPTIEVLYNDLDKHRTIAEAIQQMWRQNLGVDIELRSLEWGVYLVANHKLDYEISRGGWIADYPDPNTFLDMFTTGNENNQTGWSNPRYDEIIRAAGQEGDVAKRMSLLAEAEAMLLDEAPILPIHFYVTMNLVNPRVKGFFNTVQDEHPLKLLRIEKR